MSIKPETGKYDLQEEQSPGGAGRQAIAIPSILKEDRQKKSGKLKMPGLKGAPREEEWEPSADLSEYKRFIPRHGATPHRALDQEYVSRSAFADPGVFGRMFPTLPAVLFTDDSLVKLAERMADPSGGDDNPRLAAGYTFLGQFIDHDITFDPTSSLEKQNDPEAIHNFRTPLLELDNVYGSGPAASPFLYDVTDGAKLLVGADTAGQPHDLPRNVQGTALIGDPRNDENLIVSQLQLAFLRFHNRIVDHIRAKGAEGGAKVPEPAVFEEAQRIARWHYQWLIVHEFLPRTIGGETFGELSGVAKKGGGPGQDPIGNVLDDSLKYYRFKEEPFIPVEFAVAAYRFGHSQIRPGYRINGGFGGAIFPDLAVGPNLDPAKKVLIDGREVDFANFFETGGTPQPGKRIDTRISGPLFTLPGAPAGSLMTSLPLRNLKRGNAFRLPWGQRVAHAMRIKPLTDDELAIGGETLVSLGFPGGKAPLWYYVLKEAEVRAKGEHLGPVGGRIVGEVFLGLLKGDFKSYINQDPDWTPFLPSAKAGDFTIADLVKFASS
ncbi:MAG TPA: heme peroxidase family protein [Longimicrobium sp.]|nr:heme peroxidase family protein [Longimicrobium sp.]